MLFCVSVTLLLMGASISGAGAERIVAPSSSLRRGLQDAEWPEQPDPTTTSGEDALLDPPVSEQEELPELEGGEYDESALPLDSPPIEDYIEGEYDDIDKEAITEEVPMDLGEDPLAEAVPPQEDSNYEYDKEVEYDESLPVESQPVEEYTQGEYDDVDNEATTEELPLDVEAPPLEESPSDQEYYSEPEEPVEEGYDDLNDGELDEEISALEQEYEEEEEQMELYDEALPLDYIEEEYSDDYIEEEYSDDYIDDIDLDEDQDEEYYNDVDEYNYDKEGEDENTITAAAQAAEDLVNKRNVWIASIVVGCAMLALMLFVADQLISYPDGFCTKFCRFTLDCVRAILFCNSTKRVDSGERSGRDPVSEEGLNKAKPMEYA